MLVPRCKGLRIARIVETSNAESPTPMNIYITLQDHGGLHQDLFGLYINIPRGVPVALFLTIHLKLRSSYSVKIKAFSYAFYMYVPCPLSTPGAFCRCMTMQMYKFILRILLVGHENDYIYISISQSCLRNVDSFHLQHL